MSLSAELTDDVLIELGDLDWAAMQPGQLSWNADDGWWYFDNTGSPRPAPPRQP